MKTAYKGMIHGLSFVAITTLQPVMADVATDVQHLQQRWAEVNYQLEGKTRLSAFEQLVNEAEAMQDTDKGSAEILIWSGIIKSTYAGAKGGLGALSLAKAARADLEAAMAIDADAMDGSAYNSLGALYYGVPGWPVGFGDDDKAEELLLKALSLNPDGIDPNYFYGDFLIGEKRYAEARSHLEKALQAPARPGRAIADAGRRMEIQEKLAEIAGK
jgi:tetratricopeptide (TPR) repeat protein